MISMVKATALVSLVTLWDVMSVALKIRNDTLVTYLPLILAGAIYFVRQLCRSARAFLALERRVRRICAHAAPCGQPADPETSSDMSAQTRRR